MVKKRGRPHQCWLAEIALLAMPLRRTLAFRQLPAIARNKKSVADLVELRNTLTHYFELFDLWSEPGCEKAFEYLTASRERIGQDLEHLRGWAKSMDEARRHLAELSFELSSSMRRMSTSRSWIDENTCSVNIDIGVLRWLSWASICQS